MAWRVALQVREVHVKAVAQLVVRRAVNLYREIVTVRTGAFHDAVVCRHAATHVERVLVGSARQRDVVRGGRRRAQQRVEPIGGALPKLCDVRVLLLLCPARVFAVARPDHSHYAYNRIVASRRIAISRELVPDALLIGEFLLGIHEIVIAYGFTLYAQRTLVVDLQPALFSSFGRDDYHTSLRLRAIDGCSRSVLKHRYALYVLRVYACHAVGIERAEVARIDV